MGVLYGHMGTIQPKTTKMRAYLPGCRLISRLITLRALRAFTLMLPLDHDHDIGLGTSCYFETANNEQESEAGARINSHDNGKWQEINNRPSSDDPHHAPCSSGF
jgi:hypothetical protein